MNALLASLNDELAALVEQTLPSLVEVRSGSRGSGAGTIWHGAGLIVTNAHVVAGRGQQPSLQATLYDGRTLPARLLALDAQLDLAALSVAATGLPAIRLGDSQALRPGQWVLALGHPWGVRGAATAGIVIGEATAHPAGPDQPDLRPEGDWLAVSLHLRPGYSGGALVDEAGRLVGINTMMTGPDVGMAVPVHVARRFLQQALDNRN
jgi:serine protease Do